MDRRRTSSSIILGLTLGSGCPLCGAGFNPLQAKIVRRGEREHLFHILCGACGQSVLALVVINKAGIFSAGLLTDCSHEDARRFGAGRAVTDDDVITIHQALQEPVSLFRALQK